MQEFTGDNFGFAEGGSKVRLCWVAILFLAVQALLLQLYGPLLDHHFVERDPNHPHLYLGHLAQVHRHPYEILHTHSDEENITETQGPTVSIVRQQPDGVVFLCAYDVSSQGFAQPTAPLITQTAHFPEAQEVPRLFGNPDRDSLFPKVFVPPPEKPPRT